MRTHFLAALLALFASPVPALAQSMDGGSSFGAESEAAPPLQDNPVLRRARATQQAQRRANRAEFDPNASLSDLQAEAEWLRGRIDNANRILDAVNAGKFLLRIDSLVWTMNEQEFIERARAETILDPEIDFNPLAAMSAGAEKENWERARAILVANTARHAAALRADRAEWQARRDLVLRELDRRRREAMAEADRPGSAYDPNATYEATADADEGDGPSFEWDTRTRIYGIECFNGQHLAVYTDHYSLKGNYVGTDRREYDRIRGQALAGGQQFCGAWETRREVSSR